jgi:uncharacterized membrane protein YciS (DUF1049 family)
MSKQKWFYAAAVVMVGAVVLSSLYAVLTGNALLADTEYNTAGRIVIGLFGVGFAIYAARTLRDLWRVEKRIEAYKDQG